jgi:hypothetical protein
VIDDHYLSAAQQPGRDEKRPDRVVIDHGGGVPDHVGIAVGDTQHLLDPQAGLKGRLVAGQSLSFALQYGLMWEPPPAAWDAGQIAARLRDTIAGWRSWSALHQAYKGPWRDLVHHSGRVRQALTFAPTGGTCRSCSGSTASTTFPNASCRT